MNSYELCPIPGTPETWCGPLKRLLAESDREYVFLKEPRTDFPKTPRDPGGWNNRDAIGNHLMAWWLFGDIVALESAFNTADWLIEHNAEWDHAHCHRQKNFAALSLEINKPDKYRSAFNSWGDWLFRDKYVNGEFSGATLRPVIRVLGETVATSWVADRAFPNKMSVLGSLALKSLANWLKTQWNPPEQTWGFNDPPGEWRTPSDKWLNVFPYMDGRDRYSSASNMTWFQAGSIFPYEAMLVFLCEREAAKTMQLDLRAGDMARHALWFGYDPKTGLSLKSIGYDNPDGIDDLGCYAPGFSDEHGEFSVWDEDLREEKGEPGYHSLGATFLAGRFGTARTRKLAVNWLRRGARALQPGEVPWDLVELARRIYSP